MEDEKFTSLANATSQTQEQTINSVSEPEEAESEQAPRKQNEGPAANSLEVDLSLLEREGEIAADYLEGLLDIADLDGDIDMDVEGKRASVAIVGHGLDDLIGDNGNGLEALQELTRLAVHVKTGQRSGLMLDIADYRKNRRVEISRVTESALNSVKMDSKPVNLDPMTPFERKVVHDVVAAAGLRSESQGHEPQRYVVILPAEVE